MAETRLEIQQSQKLGQSMQTVIHLLSLDLDGLKDYMLKAIQENPALEFVPEQKSLLDLAVQVKTRFRSAHEPLLNSWDQPDTSNSVMDDLEQQLRCARLDDQICRIALQMLHQLTPRGYFTQELDEFAAEAGISVHTAQQALDALQSLEPAGIGARNVEECLALQLRQREDVDPLCYDLIRMYLLEIGKGNIRQIAKETGATIAHVNQCVEVIKSLTPAPCSLSRETVQYIMPEFSVEAEANGQLTVQFHNDYYPTFRVDQNFLKLSEKLSEDERSYAKDMLTSASRLIRAIETRQTTMERVANIIVREQRPFFLGQYSLLPLRVDEVAEEMGVHETTVYRVLQNKYLYCSRGVFPLSHFFQREVSSGSSQERVKELIREICQSNARISDREIVESLDKRGIQLSRRTVAKYRAQMGIHSSFRRNTDISSRSESYENSK